MIKNDWYRRAVTMSTKSSVVPWTYFHFLLWINMQKWTFFVATFSYTIKSLPYCTVIKSDTHHSALNRLQPATTELNRFKSIGMTWEDAEQSAINREDWHRSVAQCVYDTGWICLLDWHGTVISLINATVCTVLQSTTPWANKNNHADLCAYFC